MCAPARTDDGWYYFAVVGWRILRSLTISCSMPDAGVPGGTSGMMGSGSVQQRLTRSLHVPPLLSRSKARVGSGLEGRMNHRSFLNACIRSKDSSSP